MTWPEMKCALKRSNNKTSLNYLVHLQTCASHRNEHFCQLISIDGLFLSSCPLIISADIGLARHLSVNSPSMSRSSAPAAAVHLVCVHPTMGAKLPAGNTVFTWQVPDLHSPLRPTRSVKRLAGTLGMWACDPSEGDLVMMPTSQTCITITGGFTSGFELTNRLCVICHSSAQQPLADRCRDETASGERRPSRLVFTSPSVNKEVSC